jgi:gas vesicle protein
MNKTLNFLAGLLTGGFVGAAVALLYAPMSGEDLREQARQRFEDAKAEAERAANEQRVHMQHEFDAMKQSEPAPVA